MLKLLYPHLTPDNISKGVLEEILNFAMEMRKRVVDQLAIKEPSEFQMFHMNLNFAEYF
jgi:predicted ATP-dependent Lon-type protease